MRLMEAPENMVLANMCRTARFDAPHKDGLVPPLILGGTKGRLIGRGELPQTCDNDLVSVQTFGPPIPVRT